MILGQKVAAKRLSSSKVRVHQPDKPRTGAEKISGLRFLATEAHPQDNWGRAGGSKNEVPTTLQDRVDPWTTGRQAPNWPTTQWRDNPRALSQNGYGQPNRETYTSGFVVPLAGLRIKRVSATIRKTKRSKADLLKLGVILTCEMPT